MTTSDPLRKYRDKRNFSVTPEPSDGGVSLSAGLCFVVQKHWASSLHYDFRLELDGTMKSWAVPKGPSLDPKIKRMAVEVEDHPISYSAFEGEIPRGEYGAGKVIVWDRGIWTPSGDPHLGYQEGNLKFTLDGDKLKGKWALIRMKNRDEKKAAWLLIKEKDAHALADADYRIVDALPDSVLNAKRSTRSTPSAPKATLAGRNASLPATLKPQLATLVSDPPADENAWLYEIKYDGYRLLARIEGEQITLMTRSGMDWSGRLPHLVQALAGLGIASGWLDGEIVMLDKRGTPVFQALQNAFESARTQDIVYYLFDVPFHEGRDLRQRPFHERRALLQGILKGQHGNVLRCSEAFDVPATDLLTSACQLGLEGVIGKRKDSSYVSRRSADWIKLKCDLQQEFVIAGYTDPKGTRSCFGALLLGVYDEAGRLAYVGNVGTGFNEDSLRDLMKRLRPLVTSERPFSGETGNVRGVHWVEPTLVAEVSFTGWTSAGRLRHAVFRGLRIDKPALDIKRECAALPPVPAAVGMESTVAPVTGVKGVKEKAKAASVRADNQVRPVEVTGLKARPPLPSTLRVTHPDKVIDAASRSTKFDVITYYARFSSLMMPHLKGRPVSLVRAPEGVAGELFFQKHAERVQMRGICLLDPALDPGHAPLLSVENAEGLLYGGQMNVLEYHTWNASIDKMDRPDRMAFDLDPGHGVGWQAVQDGAMLVRALLDELDLNSYIKTSGGKGLHVIVPLKRRYTWDVVKDFSHEIVDHLARTIPKRFSAKSGPSNRVGKIFVDYLRNGIGATTVSAWSVRARPGLGVSVPIGWEELASLTGGDHWKIDSIQDRFEIGNTPWAGYATSAQALSTAMKLMKFKPGN